MKITVCDDTFSLTGDASNVTPRLSDVNSCLLNSLSDYQSYISGKQASSAE